MNTSKRCRLELRPARWLLPQLLMLGALAALALWLSRLPGWASVMIWMTAALACAPALRRLLALRGVELVEPDVLAWFTRGSTEPVTTSLQGWQRLGPWLPLRGGEGASLPLWLPGITAESTHTLLRTLARCRPPRQG